VQSAVGAARCSLTRERLEHHHRHVDGVIDRLARRGRSAARAVVIGAARLRLHEAARRRRRLAARRALAARLDEAADHAVLQHCDAEGLFADAAADSLEADAGHGVRDAAISGSRVVGVAVAAAELAGAAHREEQVVVGEQKREFIARCHRQHALATGQPVEQSGRRHDEIRQPSVMIERDGDRYRCCN
jgi:hypothetical protein